MSPIQTQMFEELAQKNIFLEAQQYAFEYLAEVPSRNVFPTTEALEDLQHFEEPLPQNPADASEVLAMLHRYGSPGTSTITGGRYFGFVNGGAVPAGLAAKWLSDFWDQNSAMQVISPICSKLEVVVEKWLCELLGLPSHTAAGFVSGSFAATFCGLAAARYRLLKNLGWDINEQGLYQAPQLRIVTATQAHSTVLKAISLLGFGKAHIEWVEVDEQGRMISEKMPNLDARTILILQAGNVNSGCYEDFEQLCQQAQQAGAWVHIDGAFGLWAAAVDSLKYLTKGIERANSWSVDGHKTLNTPYDCGIVLCEDRQALVSALHMTGAYIVEGQDRDGMFFTPEMSRRSRIVELWAVMRYLGKKGIEEMVWGLHQKAQMFAQKFVEAGFEVPNEVVFNQVLVWADSDEATTQILEVVQQERVCWCGGSIWQGRKVIRVSVCSWATTEADVEMSVASFVRAKVLVEQNKVTV
jgi:glutamate/tyrosine decarboxylase-like PLP-dependent enzyme